MTARLAEPGAQEMRARFVAGQRQEADALGQRLVLVSTSRHDIHMQEPQLVPDEVVALVERFRSASPLDAS